MSITFRAPTDSELMTYNAAKEAINNAYVPYSKFRVGAAIRLNNGKTITGCNVENASYGLTVCAERTAIVRLIAEGEDPQNIEHIAVYVDGDEGQPCGMCRQVLAEFAYEKPIIFIHGGEVVTCAVKALIPSAFLPKAFDA